MKIVSHITNEREWLERKYSSYLREEPQLATLVTYVGNKSIPILRLYRYKEAFTLGFVEKCLHKFYLDQHDYVFDPFSGIGTTLFTCMINRIPSIGVEKLPSAAFVADIIPKLLQLGQGHLWSIFNRLKSTVDKMSPASIAADVQLISLAFPSDILNRLCQWRSAVLTLEQPIRDIFSFLLLSILESASYASNDGQFPRLKPNKKLIYPDKAIEVKVLQAEQDLIQFRFNYSLPEVNRFPIPYVVRGDARNLNHVPFSRAPTALITSPPYLNRYDYSRSYCLELCFQFVNNFEELKNIRFGLLRSHIESRVTSEEKPPHPAVAEVIQNLQKKKINNPRIPQMVLGYFIDMKQTIAMWSQVMALGSWVAMVVDNVRFEGEHIPVDFILNDIAGDYGFEVKEVLLARLKGNSSQQMRKYGKFPVRESVVIWQKTL